MHLLPTGQPGRKLRADVVGAKLCQAGPRTHALTFAVLGQVGILLGCVQGLFSSLDREHLKCKTMTYVLHFHCLAHSRHLISVCGN